MSEYDEIPLADEVSMMMHPIMHPWVWHSRMQKRFLYSWAKSKHAWTKQEYVDNYNAHVSSIGKELVDNAQMLLDEDQASGDAHYTEQATEQAMGLAVDIANAFHNLVHVYICSLMQWDVNEFTVDKCGRLSLPDYSMN